MIKTTLKLAALLLVVALSSCKQQTSKEPVALEASQEVISAPETNLVLDNGQPWKANKATTEGVIKMGVLLEEFSEKKSVEAHQQLTENLKVVFTHIFQECTMKGEAHNQLHLFLIPINDLFEPLSSNDLALCQDSFKKLEAHLKIYKTYFE